jgi:undecaprenyl-diphosphatase
MDQSLVRTLSRWFSASGFRIDLARALALVPLLLIVGLVVLAWLADWGREPRRRAVLVAGGIGALVALALNIGVGHLYYRPRPFVVLPVRSLLPHAADSSFFSDQLAIAGALTVALLFARRRLGLAAVFLAALLGLGRVAAAVQYPSDTGAGFLAGAMCFGIAMGFHRPLTRLVRAMSVAEREVVPREDQDHARLRDRPFVFGAAIVLAAGIGYGVRAIADHGPIEAAKRIEAFHRRASDARPPPDYPGTTVSMIASGRYTPTHATVTGDVTQVTRELDGDIHIRIEAGGSFIVAEIAPEFSLDPPHIAQRITAWGIVRHDGLHNWWELHPLIGWQPGNLAVPGGPSTGAGD